MMPSRPIVRASSDPSRPITPYLASPRKPRNRPDPLLGGDLGEATLTNADLRFAKLRGAILPDGTEHD